MTGLEALAIVCRRLREPSTLFTVASEFGRSCGQVSRIFSHIIDFLYSRHARVLYLNRKLISLRIDDYTAAITRAGSPVKTCWGFIDGTKQYISRPSARNHASNSYENLQRSVYSGHPRRHCLNWQGITTPDGMIVSMYGPMEGRRHDSTVLITSGILDAFASDPDELFSNKHLYGDPAYGCCDYMICPFPLADPKSPEGLFNSKMSSVREAVEWSFGRLKTLWSYISTEKKMKLRQAAIGKQFLVATLLTNCHCCMQSGGNQISMYFGLEPPSLSTYLNI